jgi:hypothetical protein
MTNREDRELRSPGRRRRGRHPWRWREARKLQESIVPARRERDVPSFFSSPYKTRTRSSLEIVPSFEMVPSFSHGMPFSLSPQKYPSHFVSVNYHACLLCMHECMCVCVCMYAWTNEWMYECMDACLDESYACVRVCVCMNVCLDECVS